MDECSRKIRLFSKTPYSSADFYTVTLYSTADFTYAPAAFNTPETLT